MSQNKTNNILVRESNDSSETESESSSQASDPNIFIRKSKIKNIWNHNKYKIKRTNSLSIYGIYIYLYLCICCKIY